MDKYYWGYYREMGLWHLFAARNPEQATPEASGFYAVSRAYDTRQEAEEDDPNND